jgi:hypothetical protein
MLSTTIDTIKAVLRADHTITASERNEILVALRRGPRRPAVDTPPACPRLLRPAKAAELIGCSTRLIHRLAAEGHLRKSRFPGRKRSAGIREEDVFSLITATAGKDHAR